MPRTLRPLLAAIGVSLLLHALPFASALLAPAKPAKPPTSQPLQATLSPRLPPPISPAFILPEAEAEPEAEPPRKAENRPGEKTPPPAVDRKKTAKTWTQAIREQFSEQQRQGLFYPEEAIRQGLQGEALVLLMLDEQGHVVAARIEESSGHPLLDDAALKAVRRLRTLPADAPAESLLPVRVRLR